jgi:hypothetical protein
MKHFVKILSLVAFAAPTLAQVRLSHEDLVLSRGNSSCELRAQELATRFEQLTGNRVVESQCSAANDFDRIRLSYEPRKALPKVRQIWGSGVGQPWGSFTSGVFESAEQCEAMLPELEAQTLVETGVEVFVSSCNPGTFEGYVAWHLQFKASKKRLYTYDLNNTAWAESFIMERLGPSARKLGREDLFYFAEQPKSFHSQQFLSARELALCEQEAQVLDADLQNAKFTGPWSIECRAESLGSGLPTRFVLKGVLEGPGMLLEDFFAESPRYGSIEACKADRAWQLQRRRERNPQSVTALCTHADLLGAPAVLKFYSFL